MVVQKASSKKGSKKRKRQRKRLAAELEDFNREGKNDPFPSAQQPKAEASASIKVPAVGSIIK